MAREDLSGGNADGRRSDDRYRRAPRGLDLSHGPASAALRHDVTECHRGPNRGRWLASTDAILGELGYSAEVIADLRERKVVA